MAKTNVTKTSVNSYLLLKGKGQNLNQRGTIISYFTMYGGNLTRAEISDKTGITINAVCGRVIELVKKGYLKNAIRRKCSISGIEVNPLTLT